MQSVESKIKKAISKKKRGDLLFPDDFRGLGSSEAIRLALHRIEKEGFVKRVAQGIYVRPKASKYVGEVLPTAEEVARAIAKRDQIRLVPTGVYALSALGLSTQVPMKLVFLTDGAPREIKLGKRSIKLKKTTPKNLSAKGEISRLVIQALREIGKDQLTEGEEAKIIDLLKKEDQRDLLHDIALAPAWIRKIMEKSLDNE
jgi:ribosomal protein S19E (S16A)